MKIKGKLGRWVQNFLKSRQQIILVEKVKSNKSLIVSGIPQGSVLAPILFLIYISDIGEDILANTLVYVDDTKIKMNVKNESDVENLQGELNKLNNWTIENNMEFNKKKFQVLRYGENEALKNETNYFSGNYDELQSSKAKRTELSNGWPQVMEQSPKKCKKPENNQPG